jgi:hypothetical protein
MNARVRRQLILQMVASAAFVPGAQADTPTPGAASYDATVSLRPASPGVRPRRCLGTLLSPMVVLTSARCAEPARGGLVVSNDGQTMTVASIATYDWGLAASHAQEHDLALLKLSGPIARARAATLGTRVPCTDSMVHVVAAGNDGSDWHWIAATVGRRSPAARPFSAAFAPGPGRASAGGGVNSSDGTVVGVYSGAGSATGLGYFSRFDQAAVMLWIEGIVKREGGALNLRGEPAPVVPPLGAAVTDDRRRCAGGGDSLLEDGSADAEAPIEDIEPEPVVDPQADPGAPGQTAPGCGPAASPCAVTGATCGAAACNSSGFCNFLTCSNGRWRAVEVPPAPPR